MNHTRLISLASAIQFTIEKSKFKSDTWPQAEGHTQDRGHSFSQYGPT